MTGVSEDAAKVAALFTRPDGSFRFSRWGRALAPMIYGPDDSGIRIFEDALGTVAGDAGLEVTELDPELAANFLVFFVRDWGELSEIPQLARMLPKIGALAARLIAANATRYRVFGFDGEGTICSCITMIRYGDEMQSVSAQTLAVTESFLGLLLWSDGAFDAESPVTLVEGGRCVVKPWHANLLRAAYDPSIPSAGLDASVALRLAARLSVMAEDPA